MYILDGVMDLLSLLFPSRFAVRLTALDSARLHCEIVTAYILECPSIIFNIQSTSNLALV